MAIASVDIRRARPLLGTFVEIAVEAVRRPDTNAAIEAAFDAVAQVHRLMSFHEACSDVSRLNREARIRPIRVHAWTYRVLEAAAEMQRRSKGIFDVTVAPELQAMGLLPRQHEDAPPAAIARSPDAIELLPDQAVRFRSDVTIDLGGIAKGFAVDRALAVLRGSGIESGMVNAGGDLAAFGSPQTVHIRNPRNPGQVIGSVEICDEALASTARRFDPFQATETAGAAIVDPLTGRPPRGIDGTTVRAASCMTADALTKIAMICGTGASEVLEHYAASALLVSSDGDVHISPDWHHAVYLAA
jgi:thiamine biosynthesis lipoprotein